MYKCAKCETFISDYDSECTGCNASFVRTGYKDLLTLFVFLITIIIPIVSLLFYTIDLLENKFTSLVTFSLIICFVSLTALMTMGFTNLAIKYSEKFYKKFVNSMYRDEIVWTEKKYHLSDFSLYSSRSSNCDCDKNDNSGLMLLGGILLGIGIS